tara:strand:+ start:1287 stop:1874 length:588 start_codon:yes stop_codon:yes gene_type:complete
MSRPSVSREQRVVMRKRQADRIEAMGRAEGRALLDIEEHIGSCIKWPPHFTEMMLSTHLRFPERWQLTLFLLGNRCPPSLMVEWYLSRNALKDKSARDQVADLIRQHKDGTLEQQGRTTWVLDATEDLPAILRKHKWDGVGMPAENKTRAIFTPSFAFDWQHEWHWDEAIAVLKEPYVKVTPGRPGALGGGWPPS